MTSPFNCLMQTIRPGAPAGVAFAISILCISDVLPVEEPVSGGAFE